MKQRIKMAIYFRNAPQMEPFLFDSIGNHWYQERVIRPNGFPLYHYLQTESGCGVIEIQGKEYLLEEGEGVLIAPFVSHSYASVEGEWKTLFATVIGTMESSIPAMIGTEPIRFVSAKEGRQFEKLVEDTIQIYQKNPLDTKQATIACYRFLLQFSDRMDRDTMEKDALFLKYVAPVIKEIETNYSEHLTAEELSRKVYVTKQYLSRLFRQYVGCSVYTYLTNYRITKAKELLLLSDKISIQAIAHQVGFEDVSHFIVMFKKTVDMTPNAFRNLHNRGIQGT